MVDIGIDINKKETDLNIETAGDVNRIQKTMGFCISDKSKIPEIVEEPLIETCEIFFDKGIRTISTSAKAESGNQKCASIVVSYETLSEENKIVAQEREDSHREEDSSFVVFKIHISTETPITEISEWGEELANSFNKQSALWVEKYQYSLEKINKREYTDFKTIQEAAEYTNLYAASDGYCYPKKSLYDYYIDHKSLPKDN